MSEILCDATNNARTTVLFPRLPLKHANFVRFLKFDVTEGRHVLSANLNASHVNQESRLLVSYSYYSTA
jgi:hypothetical protein